MFSGKLKNSELTLNNILLLIFSFSLIFLVPLWPLKIHKTINILLFSIIFFLSIFALNPKARKRMFFAASIALITEWIADIFTMNFLSYISSIVNVVFFQLIVIRLIFQIAKSKDVDSNVILESVNAYLLLGLMFTMLVTILNLYDPNALNFANTDKITFQDTLYFTFVTMSTLGYGDITPQVPIAKSLSILISISGQLYIAIIVAMLVGKFAAYQNSKQSKR